MNEQHRMEDDRRTEVREALEQLERMVNRMGMEEMVQEEVRAWVGSLHRTLQQSTMRNVVLPMLETWAQNFEDNRFDARNKATCSMAHRMLHYLKDKYLPFI